MTGRRGLVVAAALLGAAATAGCGVGPGPSSQGTATLTVTRDYGSKALVHETEDDPASSETVIRFLDREAEITTRYGGGFVQSIDGLEGTESDGRRYDWFFYVNGIESPVGSAEVRVHGGDRIWWDYRDWTDAMRVPAVVGSWPQPFVQAWAGAGRTPVAVECAGAEPPCETVADRLADAGVEAQIEPLGAGNAGPGGEEPSVLVGPWGAVRRDPAAAQIEDGPATSGVFADFESVGGRRWRLVALDPEARPVPLGQSAGLIAATRAGDGPATWVVTGERRAGVRAAAGLFDERDLRDRYAVASDNGRAVPLPIVGPPGGGR